MDIEMSHDLASSIVDDKGFDGFFEYISEQYPEFDLYSMSTDWYNIGSDYICKLKGGSGDVVIRWT